MAARRDRRRGPALLLAGLAAAFLAGPARSGPPAPPDPAPVQAPGPPTVPAPATPTPPAGPAAVPAAASAVEPWAGGTLRLTFEERAGPAVLRQYEVGALSHLSYLLGAGGEGVVVDPARDVEVYLRDAETLGLTVRAVVLTHLHEDFVAGHLEVRERTGAEILVPEGFLPAFPHRALRDGEVVERGGLRMEVLATPGHAAEGLTLLVHASGAEVDPPWALTGGALLPGGVGPPEGLAASEPATTRADRAFDSLRRLCLLPPATKVLAAHTLAAFRPLPSGAPTVSTIGGERESNPLLATEDRGSLLGLYLADLPDGPAAVGWISLANQTGPGLLPPDAGAPPAVTPADLATALGAGARLVDLRPPEVHAAGHVVGALPLPLRGPLEVWVRSAVPPDQALYLAGDEAQAREAVSRLRRVGRDRVAGVLRDGPDAWAAGGLSIATSNLVEPRDLARRREAWIAPLVVDVRTPAEAARTRLPHAMGVPLTDLRRLAGLADRERPLLFVCTSGYRSGLAVGLAEALGFTHVGNLAGGLWAWAAAGLHLVGEPLLAPAAPPPGAGPPRPGPAPEPPSR